jgi:3-oxoacyl-[acyl-carrier-protein] synthase II
MSKRRVVITGQGSISPFGRGHETLVHNVVSGNSGTRLDPNLKMIQGLRPLVCGRVPADVDAQEIPRKNRRLMSDMSIFASLASIDALSQAGLNTEAFNALRSGLCIGSTTGSIYTTEEIFRDYLPNFCLEKIKSAAFFKIMNHTCASNVAVALGLQGRILGQSAACATAVQNIGLAYELIAANRLDIALAGGADEFHPLTIAIFDLLNAATISGNDHPESASRPFHRERDGIVCSEGAAVLIIESLDSALARNAPILGEIVGMATLTDAQTLAHPNPDSMERCMRSALADAGLNATEIDFINAHATATQQGDQAEADAIGRIFGANTPVSSFKGHLGHTMAACGAHELMICLHSLNEQELIPTLNLNDPDPSCSQIRLLQEKTAHPVRFILKNNFAFGGVNASVILKRYTHD